MNLKQLFLQECCQNQQHSNLSFSAGEVGGQRQQNSEVVGVTFYDVLPTEITGT